jgi:hypothetical protein
VKQKITSTGTSAIDTAVTTASASGTSPCTNWHVKLLVCGDGLTDVECDVQGDVFAATGGSVWLRTCTD